ncbi:hypothetical protein, partial [Escherichia coli]|uniref:hypothetical protein n=1 Tax=Escherichia coli TaxID=562 RepID=UPI001BC8352D
SGSSQNDKGIIFFLAVAAYHPPEQYWLNYPKTALVTKMKCYHLVKGSNKKTEESAINTYKN